VCSSDLGLAEWIEIIVPDETGIKYHFVVAMFVGQASQGELKAGDDAKDVQWFPLDQLSQLEMTPGTAELIHKTHAAWQS